MGAGGKAEDQNTRVGIAETRNRLTPIFPVTIRATLLASDLFAVDDEARTKGAGDDVVIEDSKPVGEATAGRCSFVIGGWPF